jgi:hypothetical protein
MTLSALLERTPTYSYSSLNLGSKTKGNTYHTLLFTAVQPYCGELIKKEDRFMH